MFISKRGDTQPLFSLKSSSFPRNGLIQVIQVIILPVPSCKILQLSVVLILGFHSVIMGWPGQPSQRIPDSSIEEDKRLNYYDSNLLQRHPK
jgi:hypothetical protein